MADNSAQAGASTLVENASVETAAANIEKLLSGKTEKRKTEVARAAEHAVSDAVEAEEAEQAEAAETPEPDGEEPTEPETAETSPEAPEEEPEDENEPEPLYTVKISGKEEQVPLSELISGYSRTSDYHQKTQALAEERKSFHAEAESVRQERAQYAQLLPALAQQIQAAMPQQPSIELLEADPVQYLRQKEVYERETQRLAAAYAEMQRAHETSIQEQTRNAQKMISAAREKLPELVPAWKDPKAYDRDRPKLREFLGNVGYSDDEINQAYDPRAVALAWKAMRYDELTSKTIKPTPAAPQKAIPVSASAPPSNARSSERSASREARNRLAQTGRIDDAAAAIRALL